MYFQVERGCFSVAKIANADETASLSNSGTTKSSQN